MKNLLNFIINIFAKILVGDKFILQVKKEKDIGLKAKNKVFIDGEFKLPAQIRNEGGFNYRRYLNSKNLYGIITLKNNEILLLEEGKIDFVTKLKYKIEEIFLKVLPKDYAGIINGMLNGDTKNISDDILANFKNSGITHLLAVSGSNIAYIIMFISLSSNKIFGKYLSYYIVIISIVIFIFVSGASASVARARNNGYFKYFSHFVFKKVEYHKQHMYVGYNSFGDKSFNNL